MNNFTLDPYAARSCPVKTFNAFDPTLEQPELDHSLSGLFAGTGDFRDEVFENLLAATRQCSDLRGATDREAATRAALDSGVDLILGAELPQDTKGHRRGGVDVLVRDRKAGGQTPSYLPVRIKHYRVTEKQLGCLDLETAPLHDLAARRPLPDLRFRRHREGVLLELAHLWRMLKSMGFASAPRGGIITPREEEDDPAAVWVRLDHRFLRTWSRTAVSGHRLRSPLQRYDHEHSFRVYAAKQAMTRQSGDETEPAVRPIRIKECQWCAWWEVCRSRMDEDDISLRLSRTPLDVRELQTLMTLGIRTVSELAAADLEAVLPEYLPLTTHRDRSEQRLRTAARRAQMLVDGVELERISPEPIDVPRADVEVDLDIETAEGDITYLWGMLITDRRTGEQHYEHISKFAELQPEDENELARAFSARLLALAEQHPGLRVYHYSEYEVVHLRRLAKRSGDPLVTAALELVPKHFVDLFQIVRDNFVGVDGLGLKAVATKGAGFRWRDHDPGGLNSQSWFNTAVNAEVLAERETARTRVLEYNEDDVRATWEVRQWLADLDSPSATGRAPGA